MYHRGHRKILFVDLARIYADQLMPPEFDVAVYDDVLARIRERGALDLLESSPDLGAEGWARDRLGPPYRLTREIYERQRKEEREKAERLAWEARRHEQLMAQERRRREEAAAWEAQRPAREAKAREQLEAFLQLREAAWAEAKVRLYCVASGSKFTCGCGHPPVEILLPPPVWGGGGSMMCGGRFMYTCLCGKETGMQSKRLMAECQALRVLVERYGWHEDYTPRASPVRVLPLNDVRVYPATPPAGSRAA